MLPAYVVTAVNMENKAGDRESGARTGYRRQPIRKGDDRG